MYKKLTRKNLSIENECLEKKATMAYEYDLKIYWILSKALKNKAEKAEQ